MPTIHVATDETLLSKEYKHALAKRIVALGLSRFGLMLWLGRIIYGFYETDEETGKIIWSELIANGSQIPIWQEVVEEAYGDDLSCCWNTDIHRFATELPKRRSRRTPVLLLRLRLFDGAFHIIGQPVEV